MEIKSSIDTDKAFAIFCNIAHSNATISSDRSKSLV